ncbi:ABC transporter permease [Streptomonospora litoralis]|uniref:ABC-2 family transporter protein n=1 Tax=Streptomonospora litoralis TaxID=2498135 RepID=A0A4P6Q9V2_9ACTN|nr:ABC transporter permease [Streptomonospora litoralis]QBI56219.1 ABC-2 family transporter protein [Streptomonospora litoralis]
MSSLAASSDVMFAHTVRAEWVKFRSLRSTWYTLACLLAVGLAITALAMDYVGQEYAAMTAAERRDWDPTSFSLRSHLVAQLFFGVLGTLVVTSEYATGLIRTSLTATPRRHRVLAAKLVVTAGVVVVAGQALMFAAFFLGQGLLAVQGVPNAGLGDPGVLSAIAGAGLYLSVIGLLAVGLGTLTRATAGAFATLVGIVFLVPAVAPLVPSWLQWLLDFWPTEGATAIIATVPDPAYPHPWLNFAGMCLGVAGVLAAAFWGLRRRDV